MTFTHDESYAMDILSAAFGPFPEADPERVDPAYAEAFAKHARSYIAYAVDYWKSAELAANPALPAIREKLREEKLKAMNEASLARTLEKRENQVSGILAGLIPKARKAGRVEFEISDWHISITVRNGDEMDGAAFQLIYDRGDGYMDGHLGDHGFDPEDWNALNGCDRPRDQSVALAAVLKYLEGLDAE